jgi:glycosyltransferase involved in cell wall biosynthesis
VSHDRVSVDVVICTYDNAASLDLVLQSLRAQRGDGGVDWEILVVDNNAGPDTATVLQRHLAAGGPPLRVVREAEQGLTPARLRGVRETSGEWIAFVDDDCLLGEDWIAGCGAAARAHPDAGAIGGEVVLAWDGPPPPHVSRYGWAYAEQRHGTQPRCVSCLVGAGFVLRRAALQQTGWTERQFLVDRVGAQLVSGGDVEIALRLGAHHELWYEPGMRIGHRLSLRRASPQHLARLARGLGSAKLLGDAMVGPVSRRGRIARWVRDFALLARGVVRALRYRRRVDLMVELAFLRGWLAGFRDLQRMQRDQRQALTGCARPVNPG